MNKEYLESLEFIEMLLNASNSEKHFLNLSATDLRLELTKIKQVLLKTQELEDENNILLGQNKDLYDELLLANKQYKELVEYTRLHDKVLKTILEKNVDIRWLKSRHSVDEYNRWTYPNSEELIKEEFETVKRCVEEWEKNLKN